MRFSSWFQSHSFRCFRERFSFWSKDSCLPSLRFGARLPFGSCGVSSAGGSSSRRVAASASALMRARSRACASSRSFASAASRFSFSARSRRAVEASRDSLSGGLTTTLSFRSGWAGAQSGISPKELSESESSAIVGSVNRLLLCLALKSAACCLAL
ncbi:unnamed protein product, partial [Pelagomonas calceolata]